MALSSDALENLRTYHYSSVDKSPISRYLLRHYWNATVQLLPTWLAPNTVTLVGYLPVLFNVALLNYFIPDLIGPGPRWLYFSMAASVWFYSTMDNIDGKQARRTGTSSPLGELFDHGIDSLNCTIASLLEAGALGFGATRTGAFTALIPCLPMFFSTWETYHTHTLYLGYFNGPTEGIIIACFTMILSGIYGPQIWKTPIPNLLPFTRIFLTVDSTISMRDIWAPFILSIFVLAHFPNCIVNVARARRAQNKAFLPTLLQWIPILTFSGSCIAWLNSHNSRLLKDNHLTLFCMTLSLVFGRMTTKIILAHLTLQPFPYWTMLLVPLVMGGIFSNLTSLNDFWLKWELPYLKAFFFFSLVGYARWAWVIITTICHHLKISCFTISHNAKRSL